VLAKSRRLKAKGEMTAAHLHGNGTIVIETFDRGLLNIRSQAAHWWD
jgi:hypothetical protein